MKSRKSFWENRAVAWAAFALIAALAILLGANRTVASYRARVEKSFRDTAGEYGSPAEDLKKYADHASRLFAITGDTEKNAFSAALSDLNRTKEDPFALGDAADRVYGEAAKAYQRLLASEGDDAGKRNNNAILLFAELESTRMRPRNNEAYHKNALRLNSAVKAFPASILVFDRRTAWTFR